MSLTVAQEKRNQRFALKRAQRAIANAGLPAHPGLNDRVFQLGTEEQRETMGFVRTLVDYVNEGRMTDGDMLHELSEMKRFFHV